MLSRASYCTIPPTTHQRWRPAFLEEWRKRKMRAGNPAIVIIIIIISQGEADRQAGEFPSELQRQAPPGGPLRFKIKFPPDQTNQTTTTTTTNLPKRRNQGFSTGSRRTVMSRLEGRKSLGSLAHVACHPGERTCSIGPTSGQRGRKLPPLGQGLCVGGFGAQGSAAPGLGQYPTIAHPLTLLATNTLLCAQVAASPLTQPPPAAFAQRWSPWTIIMCQSAARSGPPAEKGRLGSTSMTEKIPHRSEQLFWCTSRALGHPAPHPAPFGSRGEAACGGEGWVDSEAMDAIGEERWGLPGAREGGHVVINGGRNGGRRGVVLVCSLLGVPRALPVTVSSWLCGSNLV
eukprot:CAMPEP_0114119242 /NCGR_PEP_ID=MMETSP0043_2-20121206/6013_1 /TAXON_ID=464988 /ORGANISM="Hemiselmis andersenii, Strain CCMP644" /LENGTH=344 /DNA_ID=CAMNT_0001211789 /DNA_START=75 /DNA_END=1111 /DNA_ORIENTATION=+